VAKGRICDIVPAERAEDLIDLLRPNGKRWAPSSDDWIFRGQRDSRWELLPSAFRPVAWEPFLTPLDPPIPKEPSRGGTESLPHEYRVLSRFLEGLDRAGLDVPNGIFLPQLIERGPVMFLGFPLDPAALAFVALAQHHRIPTRLLDWTRVPLNAAYFAASGAAEHKDKSGLMSVWALRSAFAKWAEDNIGNEGKAYRPRFRVVTAPRASNPNLHAQAGVFTESQTGGGAKPIEDIVRSLSKILTEIGTPFPVVPLTRFDLPCSEGPRLLRMLAHEQIDAARMFPGREGVVRAMKERCLWDR
jgi:hypothetical protein